MSEPEAGLWSKFLITTLWKERLEILMSKTCSHSALLLHKKRLQEGLQSGQKKKKKGNLMEQI